MDTEQRGKRFKAIRESRGFTQDELASLMGVAQQQVWRWESGRNDFSGETLIKMSEILNVTADYLLGLVNDPNEHIKEEDLSPDEWQMIMAWRSGRLHDLLKAMVKATEPTKSSTVAQPERVIEPDLLKSAEEVIRGTVDEKSTFP